MAMDETAFLAAHCQLKGIYLQKSHHPPISWVRALRPPRALLPAEDHEFVTLDGIPALAASKILKADPALRRGQAEAALLYASGMQASGLVSLPLEAVDSSNAEAILSTRCELEAVRQQWSADEGCVRLTLTLLQLSHKMRKIHFLSHNGCC